MAVLLPLSNRLLSKSIHRLLLVSQIPNGTHPHPFAPSRRLCDSSSQNPNPTFDPNSNARGRSPLEKQFDTWVDRLRPGFTADDVAAAIRAQADPDLALDLFRWTALRPGYRHTAPAYLAMLQVAVSGRRYN